MTHKEIKTALQQMRTDRNMNILTKSGEEINIYKATARLYNNKKYFTINKLMEVLPIDEIVSYEIIGNPIN